MTREQLWWTLGFIWGAGLGFACLFLDHIHAAL